MKLKVGKLYEARFRLVQGIERGDILLYLGEGSKRGELAKWSLSKIFLDKNGTKIYFNHATAAVYGNPMSYFDEVKES